MILQKCYYLTLYVARTLQIFITEISLSLMLYQQKFSDDCLRVFYFFYFFGDSAYSYLLRVVAVAATGSAFVLSAVDIHLLKPTALDDATRHTERKENVRRRSLFPCGM